MEGFLRHIIDIFSKNIGVFCVTENHSSSPMWAHYAGDSCGIAIEFTGLNNTFQANENELFSCLRKVQYKTPRMPMTFEPRSHENLFFMKNHDWSYEHEWRIVLPLTECQKQTLVNGSNIFTYHISPSHITKIFLGLNMNKSHTQKVLAAIKEAGRHDIIVEKMVFENGIMKGRLVNA